MSSDSLNPYATPDPFFPGDSVTSLAGDASPRFRLSGAATAAEAAHCLRLAAPTWWRGWVIMGSIGLGAVGVGLANLFYTGEFSAVMTISGLVAVFAVIRGARRHVVQARDWERQRIGPCTPHELNIGEQGVATKTATSAGFEAWAAYTKFRSSPQAAILFYPGGAFRVIPRSLFPDDQEWQRFLEFLGAKLPAG